MFINILKSKKTTYPFYYTTDYKQLNFAKQKYQDMLINKSTTIISEVKDFSASSEKAILVANCYPN